MPPPRLAVNEAEEFGDEHKYCHRRNHSEGRKGREEVHGGMEMVRKKNRDDRMAVVAKQTKQVCW